MSRVEIGQKPIGTAEDQTIRVGQKTLSLANTRNMISAE